MPGAGGMRSAIDEKIEQLELDESRLMDALDVHRDAMYVRHIWAIYVINMCRCAVGYS